MRRWSNKQLEDTNSFFFAQAILNKSSGMLDDEIHAAGFETGGISNTEES